MKTRNRVIGVVAMAMFSSSLLCQAQQTPGTTGQAIIPPPPVTNVISIDAHNHVIVETQEGPGAPKEYSLAVPLHIYGGGLARVFGGDVIPTELLVIPQSALRSGFGNNSFGSNSFGNNGVSGVGQFGGNTNNGFAGNNSGNNFGNSFGSNFGNSFGSFNRSNGATIPLGNLNQFNQVFGALDQTPRQVETGVTFSDTTNTVNRGFGFNFNRR